MCTHPASAAVDFQSKWLFVIHSLEGTIKKSVHELSALLAQVKGPGSAQNQAALKTQQDVAAEADHILAPLMDLLDGKLSLFAQYCERTVLKRLLKELWKLVIHTLEKTSVLPPTNEKNILGGLPSAKIEDVSKLFRGVGSGQNKLPSLEVTSCWTCVTMMTILMTWYPLLFLPCLLLSL